MASMGRRPPRGYRSSWLGYESALHAAADFQLGETPRRSLGTPSALPDPHNRAWPSKTLDRAPYPFPCPIIVVATRWDYDSLKIDPRPISLCGVASPATPDYVQHVGARYLCANPSLKKSCLESSILKPRKTVVPKLCTFQKN